MIVILMGAAGAGKTTVGRALADRLSWRFVDADDLHPRANIEKMARGIPLTDADREPWLRQLRHLIVDAAASGAGMVLACSALKAKYREELTDGVTDVRWVFLQADRALLERRLATRPGHFAGPALLDTQLAALEPPPDALTLDAGAPVTTLLDEICLALGLPRTNDPSGR